MKTDTGGLAHPKIDRLSDIAHPNNLSIFDAQYERGGLTSLDYFAGQALAGFIDELHKHHLEDGDAKWMSSMARLSYEAAQAMIKEKRRLEG